MVIGQADSADNRWQILNRYLFIYTEGEFWTDRHNAELPSKWGGSSFGEVEEKKNR